MNKTKVFFDGSNGVQKIKRDMKEKDTKALIEKLNEWLVNKTVRIKDYRDKVVTLYKTCPLGNRAFRRKRKIKF